MLSNNWLCLNKSTTFAVIASTIVAAKFITARGFFLILTPLKPNFDGGYCVVAGKKAVDANIAMSKASLSACDADAFYQESYLLRGGKLESSRNSFSFGHKQKWNARHRLNSFARRLHTASSSKKEKRWKEEK